MNAWYLFALQQNPHFMIQLGPSNFAGSAVQLPSPHTCIIFVADRVAGCSTTVGVDGDALQAEGSILTGTLVEDVCGTNKWLTKKTYLLYGCR
jgi:hypothetical protein